MKRLITTGMLLAAAGLLAGQQPTDPEAKAPPAFTAAPVVKVEGKIIRVQVVRGQGMPFLDVEIDGKSAKVYLGSMRYLMQNNFNPKAGERIKVTGFRRAEDIIATSVTLIPENKTLRLRDEDGRPLWQCGRRGGRRYGWPDSEAQKKNP